MLFEITELLGDRGLADMQPGGARADPARKCYGMKNSEVVQVHRGALPGRAWGSEGMFGIIHE